jgi:hypothetical protein
MESLFVLLLLGFEVLIAGLMMHHGAEVSEEHVTSIFRVKE